MEPTKSLADALARLRQVRTARAEWIKKYAEGGGAGSEVRLAAIQEESREAENDVLLIAMTTYLEGVEKTARTNRIVSWIIAIMTAVIAFATAVNVFCPAPH